MSQSVPGRSGIQCKGPGRACSWHPAGAAGRLGAVQVSTGPVRDMGSLQGFSRGGTWFGRGPPAYKLPCESVLKFSSDSHTGHAQHLASSKSRWLVRGPVREVARRRIWSVAGSGTFFGSSIERQHVVGRSPTACLEACERCDFKRPIGLSRRETVHGWHHC